MLEIEVTPRALMQLRRAARWWRANRRSVPEAVAEDFEHAVMLLAFEPGIGTPTEGRLVVLAFWGSERELGPKL